MRSFPWDSIVEAIGEDGYPILDRACSAEDLREVVETFFTNGVFLDSDQAFQVTPDDGMSVIVSTGKCLINGTVGYEQSERKLALQGASSQDRIDTIVLRWNANIEARLIDIYVRTGVAADVPTRPALVRNETVYELGIADIYVAKNTGSVVQQRITDTRLENARCGVVMPFASIDTTTFYAQIQAAIDEQIGELQAQTDRAVELAQSAIDGTTAGNLQNQIDSIDGKVDDLSKTVTDNYDEFLASQPTIETSTLATSTGGGVIKYARFGHINFAWAVAYKIPADLGTFTTKAITAAGILPKPLSTLAAPLSTANNAYDPWLRIMDNGSLVVESRNKGLSKDYGVTGFIVWLSQQ